ncbi:MAG: hypothetical protein FWC16_12070 [Defluviitaleaceae bacterium]|nr:hypothetical protein [Defluviitaleaceae bacterium]MCL2275655.1 hypothetical protein [Defluviitaleaceae bacterium]
MENELFDDLMQSLDEALAYTQGDKTKGRSQFVSVSDNELAQRQLLWQKIDRLPKARLQLVDRYVDTLIEA